MKNRVYRHKDIKNYGDNVLIARASRALSGSETPFLSQRNAVSLIAKRPFAYSRMASRVYTSFSWKY